MRKIFFALIVTCYAACGPSPDPGNTSMSPPAPVDLNETAISGDIRIAVDETYRPLMEDMITVFESHYPKAKIRVQYMPGEKAYEMLLRSDTLRLVVGSRRLLPEEENILFDQQTSAKTTRMALDAIALVVHPQNPDSVFSFQQLTDLLTGKLTKWKEINPRSALGDIRLVFDQPYSSTVQWLQDSLLKGQQVKGFVQGDIEGVVQYVASNPEAIGVLGFPWISDKDSESAQQLRRKISVCKLENISPDCAFRQKFFQPYQGFLKAGCYPMARSMYVVSREPRFGLGAGLVTFMADDATGQRIILKAGLVPAFAVPRVVNFPSK